MTKLYFIYNKKKKKEISKECKLLENNVKVTRLCFMLLSNIKLTILFYNLLDIILVVLC